MPVDIPMSDAVKTMTMQAWGRREKEAAGPLNIARTAHQGPCLSAPECSIPLRRQTTSSLPNPGAASADSGVRSCPAAATRLVARSSFRLPPCLDVPARRVAPVSPSSDDFRQTASA